MRVYVCEYVTGGGCLTEALPASLVREGELMLRALVRDLSDIDGIEVVVSRDARLPDPGLACEVIRLEPSADAWAQWRRAIARADATWPIAPETGGALERLSRLVLDTQRALLGSTPASVAVAASKRATAARLAQCGIAVVPTYPVAQAPLGQAPFWVVKPDDGAGAEDTRLYARDALAAALADGAIPSGHVAQPYLEGTAASLSLICRDGRAWLLTANRQRIACEDGAFRLQGVVVNGLARERARFEPLARAVAAAFPGLWGYVGIDAICTPEAIRVLEINPRLTTSYAGLRAALGVNPAALVLALAHADPRVPTAARPPVDVDVELGCAA